MSSTAFHWSNARVREDELLYVLTHLVTMSVWGASERSAVAADNEPEANGASDAYGSATPLQAAAAKSPRAHLFAYYPLLLQLAFVPSAPSMWVTPGEYYRLFGTGVGGDAGLAEEDSLQDGEQEGNGDMVEVSARELARRALELVGQELCLGK